MKVQVGIRDWLWLTLAIGIWIAGKDQPLAILPAWARQPMEKNHDGATAASSRSVQDAK